MRNEERRKFLLLNSKYRPLAALDKKNRENKKEKA